MDPEPHSKSSPEDFSLYRSQATSISEVKELKDIEDVSNLNSIRIMHSINLKSMQVKMPGLQSVFSIQILQNHPQK